MVANRDTAHTFGSARRVLREAAPLIHSDAARELIDDLLELPKSERFAPKHSSTGPSEAYDADRLFRILVLDELWPVNVAQFIYEAALTILQERGIA
jgi:hypothetical protein